MQKTITHWLTNNFNKKQYARLEIIKDKWKLIQNLLIILKPFFDITQECSATLVLIIQEIFCLYNFLFKKLKMQEKEHSGLSKQNKPQSQKCQDNANIIQAI